MERVAGPELDALIAEKVMGWRPGIMPRGAEAWFTSPSGDWTEGWLLRKEFQPSYRISDAWQVVMRMGADSFSFQFYQPSSISYAKVSFICGMGPCPKHGNVLNNHHGSYDVEARTPPLAISVAALVAKGILI
jgi:hypothetical protein